jgi:ATP-dependent Clp protease ATP-binding subunit ClpC
MRFSQDAHALFPAAEKQALRLMQSEVRPDHILLAILAVPGSLACGVLRNAGIDVRALFASISEDLIPEGSRQGEIPFTPAAKQVIELAIEAAERYGDSEIAPEHVLMAVLAEGTGYGSKRLVSHGVSAHRYEQLLREQTGRTLLASAPPKSPGLKAERYSPLESEKPPVFGPNEVAQAVIMVARDQAMILGHDQTECVHLLIALTVVKGLVSREFLPTFQKADKLISEALEASGLAKGPQKDSEPSFSDRAKRAIELATGAAQSLKHAEIGSVHLLLGIMEADPALENVLRSHGMTEEKVRLFLNEGSQ